MKRFFHFVLKEFRHILRDSRTLLILIVMPLVLITLFGFAITTEVRGVRVTVSDLQGTQQTRRVREAVGATERFSLVAQSRNMAEAERRIWNDEADAALCFDRDGRLMILSDGSEPNQGQMRAAYLMQIVEQTLRADAKLTEAGALDVRTRFLYNPQQLSSYNFVPAIIGMILLLICAMMTSIAIVREKEQGTMELLLASPLPAAGIIVGKLIPYLVISGLNLAMILLLSRYVLGVPVRGSLAAFIVLCLLYIVVSLALGLLISSAVNSQLAALLLSLLLIVPAMYLSGFVFPLESMPEALRRVSVVVPTRWFASAARRLLIQGVSVRYVLGDMLVLAAEAVVLMSLSWALFKKRL